MSVISLVYLFTSLSNAAQVFENADTSISPPELSDFVYPPFDIDSFNDFLAREPTP